MAVVRMRIADILDCDSTDYKVAHIVCKRCHHVYGVRHHWGKGRYFAEHHPRAKCLNNTQYTTYDIIASKRFDEQMDYLADSMYRVNTLPIARVSEETIWDGGHRLAVAIFRFNLHTVLVETEYTSCTSDSGEWYPDSPIDITSVKYND